MSIYILQYKKVETAIINFVYDFVLINNNLVEYLIINRKVK